MDHLWHPTSHNIVSLSTESLVEISSIPFVLTNWAQVERTEQRGETGTAYLQTRKFGEIRIRMVQYTAGYVADHWCSKGHVVLCVEGRLDTELRDGRKFTLTRGMSYQVSDNAAAHRSSTATGAKLFIVD